MLAIVVAHGRNRVIGVDGDLPWHLPADLAHFRDLTMGHPVIMGRKTYESIPAKFRPLPGRRNLVLSQNPNYAPAEAGAEVYPSLEHALRATEGHDAFVIGGGRTYGEALRAGLIDRVYATEVDLAPAGDAFFPPLGRAWHAVEERDPVVEADGTTFTVRVYERVPGPVRDDVTPSGEDRSATIGGAPRD